MKLASIVFGGSVVVLLSGCATVPPPKPIPQRVLKAKHVEPCPCSPTANQVIQKRWYDGFRVKWLH